MINSLGPKKSRTKFFEKKSIFPVTKFLAFFSRFILCDKAQGTFRKGPTGILTITVEVIGAFFQDLRLF